MTVFFLPMTDSNCPRAPPHFPGMGPCLSAGTHPDLPSARIARSRPCIETLFASQEGRVSLPAAHGMRNPDPTHPREGAVLPSGWKYRARSGGALAPLCRRVGTPCRPVGRPPLRGLIPSTSGELHTSARRSPASGSQRTGGVVIDARTAPPDGPARLLLDGGQQPAQRAQIAHVDPRFALSRYREGGKEEKRGDRGADPQ
jgi:hypothetical protein